MSASLERYPYKTIHSDHINMTKFRKRDDNYRKVSIELKRWISGMVQEPGSIFEQRVTKLANFLKIIRGIKLLPFYFQSCLQLLIHSMAA